MQGTTIGLIKGDTRSLDYSSYVGIGGLAPSRICSLESKPEHRERIG